MISFEQARQLIKIEAHSFCKETIELDEALHRVIAEPVIADRDYPPFNRATMDGIAINYNDWENGIRTYNIIETIYAGTTAKKEIKQGDCYKIMTGAAVPTTANVVIRREDIEEKQNTATVNATTINTFQNIAAKGSDTKKGATLISNNQLIKAGLITTLASLGYNKLQVEKLPSVCIITTGNEVSNNPTDVQIRNSNASLLKSLLQQWKIKPTACLHLNDDLQELVSTISKQKHNDIILLNGAVSAGDADFVPEALLQCGATNIFHKVAIRPGRPLWFGKFDNGAIVFALPGNPYSTFVTFKIFIEYFLHHCFSIEQPSNLFIPLNESRSNTSSLTQFFPINISGNPSIATQIPFNTSGDITAVQNATALGMHPSNKTTIEKNEIVECILL